jgi:archaellum component FlaG (FlaF/FlaG flagellin family)
MGFGTIVANIVLFISVLLLATAMVGVFKGSIESTSDSLNTKTDYLSKKISTNLEVNSVVFDNSTNTTTAIVLNSGSTILDIDNVDVFIDGFFIPRNASNRTIRVLPSTEVRDSGLWNPSELIEVKIFKYLDNSSHTFAITTQYGNKAEERISQ